MHIMHPLEVLNVVCIVLLLGTLARVLYAYGSKYAYSSGRVDYAYC